MWKASEDIARLSHQILQKFVWLGVRTYPPPYKRP